MIGDAIHAFPPDLGQGVNSGLQDVAVLRDALSESADLHTALEHFQTKRLPNVLALMKLMQVRATLDNSKHSGLDTLILKS